MEWTRSAQSVDQQYWLLAFDLPRNAQEKMMDAQNRLKDTNVCIACFVSTSQRRTTTAIHYAAGQLEQMLALSNATAILNKQFEMISPYSLIDGLKDHRKLPHASEVRALYLPSQGLVLNPLFLRLNLCAFPSRVLVIGRSLVVRDSTHSCIVARSRLIDSVWPTKSACSLDMSSL